MEDINAKNVTEGIDKSDENSNELNYLSEPCLENIPVEIFLEICSYLEPSFIIHTLSIVCKRFEAILADDTLWRYWVKKRLHNNRYPPITCPEESIKWDEECILIDRLNSLWKVQETTLKHVELKNVHYASVDSVLLLREGSICVSGARDRTIAVWNVKDVCKVEDGSGERLNATVVSAHGGWIWDLACPSTSSDTIFSAAWDSCVKAWSLNEGLKETNSFKCALSVLCVTCIDENVAVAGLFSPEIVILDKRSGNRPVSSHKVHKGSVLDITCPKPNTSMLYTCSEDKTVAIFDMRKGLLRRRKHLDSSLHTYALSLTTSYDFCPHALYAGDTNGNIHLLDMRTLQKLSTTPTFTSAEGSKINGLILNPGALFACSEAGNISIMNPSFPPIQVSTASANSKISGMYCENDVLAIGTCDSSVELWVPVERLNEAQPA